FGSVSGLSVDLSTWRRVGDSYTGSLITLPDRGYNVAGTTNYIDRLQTLRVNFTPYYGTTPLPATQQNQFQATLAGTTLLTEANGNPTTGLDALPQPGARPAQNGFPVLPQAGNGRISLDPEAIVRNRDGTFWISDEYGPYIYRFDRNGKLL